MKKLVAAIVIIILALVVWFAWLSPSAEAPNSKGVQKSSSEQSKPAESFDKSQFSLTNASSPWVIVNKLNQLNPKDYAPTLVIPNIPMSSSITNDEKHVSSAMAPALEQMFAAAKSQGVNLILVSGYRSYNFQVNLYNRYVQENGSAEADTFSARPGYSEHQTGLAADLGGTSNPSCNIDQCFANTSEGKWLAANAYKFGFIVRYPQGLENITGYEYEPWHMRYVGIPLATQMRKTDMKTLEQFFGLPPAPNYQ